MGNQKGKDHLIQLSTSLSSCFRRLWWFPQDIIGSVCVSVFNKRGELANGTLLEALRYHSQRATAKESQCKKFHGGFISTRKFCCHWYFYCHKINLSLLHGSHTTAPIRQFAHSFDRVEQKKVQNLQNHRPYIRKGKCNMENINRANNKYSNAGISSPSKLWLEKT